MLKSLIERLGNKRFTIFISSTYLDLKDYRETVRTAVFRMRNHASDMIYWSADERRPDNLSIDELREADLVILILAHRYGTIPEGQDRSITEIEYDAATEANIPVIPFFIERKYSWPGDMFDVKHYDRLEKFKEKVGQDRTPVYFTTMDSLAARVTEALVNFDKRHNRVVEAEKPNLAVIDIRDADALENIPDVYVLIGEAEDGLPLALTISRSDNLREPLSTIENVFSTLKESGVSGQFNSILKILLKESDRSWAARGIVEIPLPTGEFCRGYVSKKTISALFKSSILGFLLPVPSIGDSNTELSQKVTTARLMSKRPDPRIQSVAGNNRFLALALTHSKRMVVGKNSDDNKTVFWHFFIQESLKAFDGCEYETKIGEKVISKGELARYPQKLRADFENAVSKEKQLEITFKVRRQAIGKLLVQILAQIETQFHSQNVIHGDIKPHNILVTEEGVQIIDGLGLKEGEISPAFTPGWAAPEQITLRPVSFASDVFPFGLMLVSLLEGKLSGEIVTYQVPTREREPRVQFIRDPYLYLDSSKMDPISTGKKEWVELVQRCLSFDSNARPPNAKSLLILLEDLLNKYPLTGDVVLRLNRGTLQIGRMPDGREKICRILDDEKYSSATEISSKASFTKLRKCPFCSFENESIAEWCDNCGTGLRSK